HAHHAKALPGRRLHDPPRVDLLHAPRAQAFQTAHLGLDVVRFYVQVQSTLMGDLLHFDVDLVLRRHQLTVRRTRLLFDRLERVAERIAPEARGAFQVLGLAIDDETGETTAMHGVILLLA